VKISFIISYILVIIGAIVWLSVGLFAFNPVAALFGSAVWASRLVYALVGIAGLWLIFWGIFYKPFKNA